MGKGCGHDHHHGHHHGHSHAHHHGDQKLGVAVFINVVLTAAQLVGGIFAGSLALIADALHNFSDAGALLLALIARRIARRAPDDKRTYGYKKVETLAAFTNFLILILIAAWLAVEAVMRFFDPNPVMGNIVFILAALGLVINGGTALLVRAQARTNQNMRAAYLHNVTDAFSSLGVMVAGFLITSYGWVWVDPLITILISAYIVIHAMHDFPHIINILIDGKPGSLSTNKIVEQIRTVPGVQDMHHIHIRQLGENVYALEAHILIGENQIPVDRIKAGIKEILIAAGIEHSTLEFEMEICGSPGCD